MLQYEYLMKSSQFFICKLQKKKKTIDLLKIVFSIYSFVYLEVRIKNFYY